MRLRSEAGSMLLHYQSRFSMRPDVLRHTLAGYLRDRRGVHCDWQEIAITGGSQQALFMLGHLLLDEARTAYMETPRHPGVRPCCKQARYGRTRARRRGGYLHPTAARCPHLLVYVIPSHQFPLGSCMSLERRMQLLQISQEHELWIVKDDCDAEFHYSSAPKSSLQGLNESGFRAVAPVVSAFRPGLKVRWIARASAISSNRLKKQAPRRLPAGEACRDPEPERGREQKGCSVEMKSGS